MVDTNLLTMALFYFQNFLHTLQYITFRCMEGDKQKSLFIGPDSEEIRQTIDEVKETKLVIRELSQSLFRIGGFVFRGREGRILASLSDAGFFLSGAILLGTHAFLSYQNVFGVRWGEIVFSLQTTDIDFAQLSRLRVGVPLDVAESLKERLSEINAHPIRRLLQADEPPWGYVLQEGGSIAFLSPLTEKNADADAPLSLPWEGVHAHPVRIMDYLIEDSFHAVALLHRGAILVNLPDPGRFALHKLIVHEWQSASESVNQTKDLAQAGALIAFLSEKHPDVLVAAWMDLLKKHRAWGEIV